MYSSEDFERFYFQYQTEALPVGESIQAFCLRRNVPYNLFSKWYKDTRKKIVEVKVDGLPSPSGDTNPGKDGPNEKNDALPPSSKPVSTASSFVRETRIRIDLRSSNGLHLTRKDMSYQDLVDMVGRLEGISAKSFHESEG